MHPHRPDQAASVPLPLAPVGARVPAEPGVELEHSRRYPFTTTMLPAAPFSERGGPELYDAAHECEHGRLPSDRTPACGCWSQENGAAQVRAAKPAQRPALTAAEARAAVSRDLKRAERVSDGPPKIVSGFAAGVLRRLDQEIDRLTRARDRIQAACRTDPG